MKTLSKVQNRTEQLLGYRGQKVSECRQKKKKKDSNVA